MALASSYSPPLKPYYLAVSARTPSTSSRDSSLSFSPHRRVLNSLESLVLNAGLLLPLEKHGQPIFRPASTNNATGMTVESVNEDASFCEVLDPNTRDEFLEGRPTVEQDHGNPVSEGLGEDRMIRVCDKLIGVFLVDKPTPTDWRRLLTFSKEWNNIRPYFFKQCQDRAERESNPEMKLNLLRLSRKLKEIDEDIQKHNELLGVIRKSSSDIGDIVARRRKDFTKEFFVHVYNVAESYFDNPTEKDAITKIANKCVAAVQAYDTAAESIEALNAAELKFQEIINSPSVDAACRKIDDLADKNQLDSSLVLMITKAWSAAKESNMMKDEAKDVLYHLYKTARANLQRLVPKEIRILKYLLTIEDPEEYTSALNDAFTPGQELEGQDVDSLYTTPEQLHTWVRTVIDAYKFSRQGTLISEARDLMNPKVIPKLEQLKKIIQDKFM